MKKLALFLGLLLICFAYSASAAVISGKVYDLSLELVMDAVVEINTDPQQAFVTKDGGYSFNVPLGNYTINAKNKEGEIEENLNVKTEGNYTLDLILWPSIDEENDLINTADELGSEEDMQSFEKTRSQILIYGIGIILVLAVYVVISRWKKIIKMFSGKPEAEKKVDRENDGRYIHKIIEILKDEGGRATQKEIRKNLPLSEAKISLLLAELEHYGKIEKFKKGRTNIVVLKK
jgi:uncharacterized membrane protein